VRYFKTAPELTMELEHEPHWQLHDVRITSGGSGRCPMGIAPGGRVLSQAGGQGQPLPRSSQHSPG
jgi:hypothetical protein